MKRIGHCADGYHAYCGGREQDKGDGTWVQCHCPCHRWDGDGLSIECECYQDSKENGEYDNHGK